jgi:hypothetical protein
MNIQGFKKLRSEPPSCSEENRLLFVRKRGIPLLNNIIITAVPVQEEHPVIPQHGSYSCTRFVIGGCVRQFIICTERFGAYGSGDSRAVQ